MSRLASTMPLMLDGVSRETYQMAADPPHEIIERVIDANPSMLERLHVVVASRDLQTTYYDHPLLRTSAEPPLPVALHIDGLPYTLVDSVLGVWLVNLVTGTQHIVGIIQKF